MLKTLLLLHFLDPAVGVQMEVHVVPTMESCEKAGDAFRDMDPLISYRCIETQ